MYRAHLLSIPESTQRYVQSSLAEHTRIHMAICTELTCWAYQNPHSDMYRAHLLSIPESKQRYVQSSFAEHSRIHTAICTELTCWAYQNPHCDMYRAHLLSIPESTWRYVQSSLAEHTRIHTAITGKWLVNNHAHQTQKICFSYSILKTLVNGIKIRAGHATIFSLRDNDKRQRDKF